MISICVATRKRSECFKRLCATALSLADNPDGIEIVSYHDSDDDTHYEYIGNHKEVIGPRGIDIFRMANECQKVAAGPIYMYTADDFYFVDKGWDTEVLESFDKYEDKIVLVCPDGRFWKNWKIGVVGFLHKNWVDTVGYLLPPYDGGQAADKWVNELAVAINRRVRIRSSVIHSNEKDETFHAKNSRCFRGKWTRKYSTPELIEQRRIDAEKLNNYILYCSTRTAGV